MLYQYVSKQLMWLFPHLSHSPDQNLSIIAAHTFVWLPLWVIFQALVCLVNRITFYTSSDYNGKIFKMTFLPSFTMLPLLIPQNYVVIPGKLNWILMLRPVVTKSPLMPLKFRFKYLLIPTNLDKHDVIPKRSNWTLPKFYIASNICSLINRKWKATQRLDANKYCTECRALMQSLMLAASFCCQNQLLNFTWSGQGMSLKGKEIYAMRLNLIDISDSKKLQELFLELLLKSIISVSMLII